MLNLESLAQSYLESIGFQIHETVKGCLVAGRIEFWGRDTRIVQTVQDNRAPRHELLDNVTEIRTRYPDSRATILAHSREGFSRDDLTDISAEDVQLLVPVQFFDSPFKVEQAPRTVSAITKVRNLAEKDERIPQPYQLDGEEHSGEDLFDTLLDELTNESGPQIRFVIGRAGIGKSLLFRALFQRMYSIFLESKNRQTLSKRPIPLLPDHLKGSNATRINHLIQTFLDDDIASPILPKTFSWLLKNGFTTWMLDGLDELYAGESDFFEDIFDLVAEKGSNATITVWCRDSLLTSSQSFADFLDMFEDEEVIKVYRMTDWERRHKRLLAWRRVEGHQPQPQQTDPAEVSTFLSAIDSNKTLRLITSLPFYCNLVFDRTRETGVPRVRDDFELLNIVINELVAREKDKGLLNEDDFDEDGLEDWMEAVADEYIERQGYIDMDQARDYARVVLREDLEERKCEDTLQSLLQFPLFVRGEELGRIEFDHDLLAHALAARLYLKQIRKKQPKVFERLSGGDFEESPRLRFVASRLEPGMNEFVLEQVRNGITRHPEYSTALFLLLQVRSERDLVAQENIQLAGKNLTGISFSDRDLAGHRFNDCDLSRVTFLRCDLRDSSFEGAVLMETKFDQCMLEGARFGNFNRIKSMYFGSAFLRETVQIRDRLHKETGRKLEVLADPCPTALQVVMLLGKFVNPLGEPRSAHIDKRLLVSGRKVAGAATPNSCVQELVRHKYLKKYTGDDRYSRCSGSGYAEIVAAVRDGVFSDGIMSVVKRLCQRTGCSHRAN